MHAYGATSPASSRDRSTVSAEDVKPNGSWPAPAEQLAAARTFLKECAISSSPTLLLPDKDADGLASGLIVYHTLLHLGLASSLISVHFPAKGSNIHAPAERARIAEYAPRYVIVNDQGSRGGPPIVEGGGAKTLVVDHHCSAEFPEGAVVCSAAMCPPVATSSTLAYVVCKSLVDARAGSGSESEGDSDSEGGGEILALRERLEWLCALGTMGDLGTSFKWEPPFPDMHACLKKWTKKALGEAIGLLNAPRRSPEYDVLTAWRSLLSSPSPRALVSGPANSDVQRLYAARAEVKAETDRCSRKPPTFSGDGRVALIRISSAAQIHPLIATRWSSSLKGPRLEVVMCANDGYSPGMTNFACRVARSRRTGQDDGTDIIATLKEYAGRVPGLREAMGDDFARGHKEASGGIVRTEQFERLWEVISNSEREEGGTQQKRRRTSAKDMPRQKNTLEGWLQKKQ